MRSHPIPEIFPMTPNSVGRPSLPRTTTLLTLAVAVVTMTGPAVGLGAAADSPAGRAWKVGLAKAVITPETAVWLAGYGTKRAPDGKLHDLWMKALALEDRQGRRVVLVTSDFQGVPKAMSDRVFERLKKRVRARTPPGHDHLLAQPLRPAPGRRPGGLLPRRGRTGQARRGVHDGRWWTRLVELVGEALADLAPATPAARRGQARPSP